MRELNLEEVADVEGGLLFVGSALGAVAGGWGVYISGGNAGQIAAGAILGGVAGFYGGVGMLGSATAVSMIGAFAGVGSGGVRWNMAQ